MTTDGKTPAGTGSSKKNAQGAAARRYFNSIFLRRNSPLLGKEVCVSEVKVPSNKKLIFQKKMEKFLIKKRAAADGDYNNVSPEKMKKGFMTKIGERRR